MVRKMKDSGVKWLGLLPANWQVDHYGSLFSLRNEKVSDKDYPPLSVTMQGIVPQLSHVAKSDDHTNRKLALQGDFVINSRSDRRNSCGFTQKDGSVSLINTVCVPRMPMDSRYFEYLFDTSLWADEFYAWGHGIVSDLWTTSWNEMKSIAVPVPPVNDQKLIADYLDLKCTEINSAIRSAVKTIEDRNDYKTSTIVEAIMSCGTPNVKLNLFSDAVLGKMLDSSKQLGTNLHPYLANKNVRWFSLDTSNLPVMDFPEADASKRYGIQDGDILVCEGGEVGRCCVWRGSSPSFYFQKAIHRVRVDKKMALPEFIAYQMYAKAKTTSFVEVRKGQSTFSHLTGDQLKELRFSLPPISKQRATAASLDRMRLSVDRVIAQKQSIINDLKAYKQSLIYEVVTGKREV